MGKTPENISKNSKKYHQRMKAAGYVNYQRIIKPEWKVILDELLEKLKKDNDINIY